MIKIILLVLVCVAGFLFMGETKISTSPFKVTIGKPYFMVGWLLILVGISLIQYQSQKKGIEDGRREAIELIKKMGKK